MITVWKSLNIYSMRKFKFVHQVLFRWPKSPSMHTEIIFYNTLLHYNIYEKRSLSRWADLKRVCCEWGEGEAHAWAARTAQCVRIRVSCVHFSVRIGRRRRRHVKRDCRKVREPWRPTNPWFPLYIYIYMHEPDQNISAQLASLQR